MLRVGLTGGLGSGKSTIAGMFARHGVHLLHADEIGRELMQPGQSVYRSVMEHFRQYSDAPQFAAADAPIDRDVLARYVFSTGRLAELNRIVHPAVIAEQERRMDEIFHLNPNAIVMVESALMFEADRGGTAPGLSHRFDKLILVAAPEDVRLTRYVARVSEGRTLTAEQRSALEEDGRRRMAMQMSDTEKVPLCDYVIENSGPLEKVESEVRRVFLELSAGKARGAD